MRGMYSAVLASAERCELVMRNFESSSMPHFPIDYKERKESRSLGHGWYAYNSSYGRLRQEDHKFKTSFSNLTIPCLKILKSTVYVAL